MRPSRRAAVAAGLLLLLAAAPTLLREAAPEVAASGWYAATWAPQLLSLHLPPELQVVPPGAWGADPWGQGFAGRPLAPASEQGPARMALPADLGPASRSTDDPSVAEPPAGHEPARGHAVRSCGP